MYQTQGRQNTRIIAEAGSLLLLLAVLLSCQAFTTSSVTDPTDIPETQTVISSNTSFIETQSSTATHFLDPTAVFTPAPDQQVYTDPQGWYSIFFPVDMKLTDKPNAFARVGNFLETGYLPEMGYMSNIMNVCAWVANVDLEPEQSTVDWSAMFSPRFQTEPRCSVFSQVNEAESLKYEIFENPGADPEHRFVYIKTRWNPFSASSGQIPTALMAWLKPISPRQEFTLSPLRNYELSFWSQTAPLLESATVAEFALPPGSDPAKHEWLLRELPEAARSDWFTNRANLPTPTNTPTVDEQLKPLGYELRVIHEIDPYRVQLLRDDRLLFDYVYKVSDVYRYATDSGSITAFIVNTKGTGGNYQDSFLIQNDAINTWEYNHQSPPFAPILYQNEILWVTATKDFYHVQIRKSSREAIFSFSVFTEPMYAVRRFSDWHGHWILAARDFLIQDGEIINEKLGYEEIFSWGLVEDKPIYLFRKGPRIGLSYDGKILALEYQNVARYLCCGYAVNNPQIDSNGLHFYGKRNGVWYYVVVDVR